MLPNSLLRGLQSVGE